MIHYPNLMLHYEREAPKISDRDNKDCLMAVGNERYYRQLSLCTRANRLKALTINAYILSPIILAEIVLYLYPN